MKGRGGEGRKTKEEWKDESQDVWSTSKKGDRSKIERGESEKREGMREVNLRR
jgi:hypothetical protein